MKLYSTPDPRDRVLRVDTRGIIKDYMDEHHQFYEPTNWNVIDKIIQSGYITEHSKVVDYGCGKGRVAFALNNAIGCKVTGIEFAKEIYLMAEENLRRYGLDKGVEFVNASAEDYEPVGADTFYFFNPFSVETMKQVLLKILATSTAQQLIFYYPWNGHEEFLLSVPELTLIDEIDCRRCYGDSIQNKIMIFNIKKGVV